MIKKSKCNVVWEAIHRFCREKESVMQYKLNINSVFNQKEDYVPSKKAEESPSKSEKEFMTALEDPIVDLDKLKRLSWHGIPRRKPISHSFGLLDQLS